MLNLIVSARYPQEFLKEAGSELLNNSERPWLWRSRNYHEEVAIVVCRELPLEPIYYDWLAFAPADSEAWRVFVRRLISERRRDLLELVRNMRPKEFDAMRTDYLAELDPQEKARLEAELLEVIEGELNELAQDNPAAFDSLLERLELIRQKRLAQANKNQKPGKPSSEADEPQALE